MSRRTGVLAGAAVIGAGALWFGWPWLVVAGLAPILIALLPCLIMCGAMCAMGMCSKKKSGAAAADVGQTTTALSGSEPVASAQRKFGPAPAPVPGSAADTGTPA